MSHLLYFFLQERTTTFQLSIDVCFVDGVRRFYHFVKMSNEPPENARRCAKIRIGDREGPSRAIREIHMDGVSVGFLSFCSVFPSVCSLPSVFSDGRTQCHTSEIGVVRGLKNENTSPLSYGRTTTTVRTRRYGGADPSVRSQSQVLLFVKRGAKEAFFVLERVSLCEFMSI